MDERTNAGQAGTTEAPSREAYEAAGGGQPRDPNLGTLDRIEGSRLGGETGPAPDDWLGRDKDELDRASGRIGDQVNCAKEARPMPRKLVDIVAEAFKIATSGHVHGERDLAEMVALRILQDVRRAGLSDDIDGALAERGEVVVSQVVVARAPDLQTYIDVRVAGELVPLGPINPNRSTQAWAGPMIRAKTAAAALKGLGLDGYGPIEGDGAFGIVAGYGVRRNARRGNLKSAMMREEGQRLISQAQRLFATAHEVEAGDDFPPAFTRQQHRVG